MSPLALHLQHSPPSPFHFVGAWSIFLLSTFCDCNLCIIAQLNFLCWCFPEILISCVFSAQMTVPRSCRFLFSHCGGAAAAATEPFAVLFSSVWCVGGCGNCRWWENNGEAAGICSCHYQLSSAACNYFKGVAINSRSANNVNIFCLHSCKCQRFSHSFRRERRWPHISEFFYLPSSQQLLFPVPGVFCLASRISSHFLPKIERTPIARAKYLSALLVTRIKQLYAKSSRLILWC